VITREIKYYNNFNIIQILFHM